MAGIDITGGGGSATSTLTLTDTHIFVGDATNTAQDVALTLNASGGSFSLANTGVLTMPDADSVNRGLLTSTDWNVFNSKLGSIGTNYIIVEAKGTPLQNGTDLETAYNYAVSQSPNSGNIWTIIATPGYYEFNTYFDMNTEYINLVSIDGNQSLNFSGSPIFGTDIVINNDNIFVLGVKAPNLFQVTSSRPNVRIENCFGASNSFTANINASTYVNCTGVDYCFNGQDLSGNFIDCTANEFSFGWTMGFGVLNMGGVWKNCVANNNSFGYDGIAGSSTITLNGTFEDCVGQQFCFAGNGGDLSGTFRRCRGAYNSFAGTLNGKFFYCELIGGMIPAAWGIVAAGQTIYCIDDTNGPNNQGFVAQNNV